MCGKHGLTHTLITDLKCGFTCGEFLYRDLKDLSSHTLEHGLMCDLTYCKFTYRNMKIIALCVVSMASELASHLLSFKILIGQKI